MAIEEKFVVPKGFRRLVAKQMKALDYSLRKVARLAEISPSFLSRILTGERGLPGDEDILRLASALEIEPPEKLLIEAGRVKPKMLPLLRVSSELSTKELEQVRKVARDLAQKRHSKKRRTK